MLRVINNNLGRALHAPLYNRLTKFCNKYTPELPPSIFVTNILQRLYSDDDSLYVFVEMEDNEIVAHAVLDIQNISGHRVFHCYQYQRDEPDLKKLDTFLRACEKLAELKDVHSMSFVVAENPEGYKKRYGYDIVRSVMVKVRPSEVHKDG